MSLAALKFLHLKRHILFHGHEPLDTDSIPTLEGEDWLMHHGYAQAEGVASLVGVPATGCLVEMGFPRFGGGLGGYARYVAICPPAPGAACGSARCRRRRCGSTTRRCIGTRTSGCGCAEPRCAAS